MPYRYGYARYSLGAGDGKGGYPPENGPAPSPAIELVASAIAGASPSASDPAVTAAIDTTGATLIVIGTSYYLGGGSVTLTDSAGNTWTALSAVTEGTPTGRLYYCENPTTNAAHTFTLTPSGTVYPCIGVLAFANAGNYDQFVSAHTVAQTLQPGSLTPPTDNGLFVTILASQTNGGDSINSGFTLEKVTGNTAAHLSLGMAYFIQETAGALNPTWSTNLAYGQAMVVCMATFEHA